MMVQGAAVRVWCREEQSLQRLGRASRVKVLEGKKQQVPRSFAQAANEVARRMLRRFQTTSAAK